MALVHKTASMLHPALRPLLSLLILVFTAFTLSAQQLDLEWMDGMKIRSVGPAGMSGRVTSIDALVDNPSVIYAGTASGGLWRTESGGISWEPLFESEDILSIGAIAVDQSNPSVIWAGTGEGNPRNSHNSGIGLFKSIDGGRTWEHLGLEATKTIHRIILHRDDPNTVFVAATGSAWGPSDRGIFRTTDGGQNWERVLYVNDSTGCGDLVVDPNNPNKLVAAMWEFGRKPWTFNSGGEGSGIYVSYDAGTSWKRIEHGKKSGLPEGNLGRIGLSFAASRHNWIYAYVESKKENAVYLSKDGGHNWSKRGSEGAGNRPFYYADIYVDPSNENRIFSIHSTVTRSEDGGKNWSTLIPYSGVHPDHHALWIHPTNPDFMIEGNDGGLNISHDRGENWRFIENLPLGQFYHIRVDDDLPYNIYGGLQDNGSWVGPSYIWQSGGIRNANWQEVLFGDGFDVLPDPANNRFGYAMWQGGGLARYDRETGYTQNIRPFHPEGEELRFNWNAALAPDPFDDGGLYYGSQYVHYSNDRGNSWSILSPDLTTNDSAKQLQSQSGGLTIDATGAENFTSILSIEPSTHSKDVIWVGTDDGHLQLTRDRGNSWTEMSGRLPSAPKGAWIPQIHASRIKAGEAFVVLNDYRRNNWDPYCYHTNDFGASWTRIASSDQVQGHVMSIVQDLEVENLLFMGTDAGLWVSIDYGKNWTRWDIEFPAASVRDLALQEREADLVVGTFGRAIWVLDDIRPLRAIASNQDLLERPFAAFESPDAYMASYRQPPGVRFDGDAGYRGENRPYGAQMSLWINPSTFEKDEAKKEEPETEDKKSRGKKNKKDEAETEERAEEPEMSEAEKALVKARKDKKLRVWVIDDSGDTVRSYSTRPDTGLVRIGWNLREDGVRWPSWEKPKKDSDPPSGIMVKPGTYKVVFRWKGHKDSTSVKVHSDPRMEWDVAADEEARVAMRRGMELIDAADKSFALLREAKEAIGRVKTGLENVPDSIADPIHKGAKALSDSISRFQHEMRTPQNFKGIDGEVRLTDWLWRSVMYLDEGSPANQNSEYAYAAGRQRIGDWIDRINAFMAGPWVEWMEKVEAVEWTPVPAWEPLKIED